MLAWERRQKIIEIIEEKGKAEVGELCSLLSVSDVTIRKDLSILCDSGLARRVFGGAMKVISTRFEQTQAQKAAEHMKEKTAIAKYAVSQIRDGETVLIAGGTTTQGMIDYILQQEWKDLTIATNSMVVASKLLSKPEGITLIVIGGLYRPNVQTFVGPLFEEVVNRMVIDRVFISVNGISSRFGVTSSNMTEGKAIESIMRAGLHKYLLCDSSKFGKNALYRICDPDEFDMIISDSRLLTEFRDEFENRKFQLVVVEAD